VSTSVVFHNKTGNGIASIESSKSVGKVRKIEDSSGLSIDNSGFDMIDKKITFIINKVLIKRTIHTESMDEFVEHDVDREIVCERIFDGVSNCKGSSVETNVDNNGSLDSGGDSTKGSGPSSHLLWHLYC